MKTFTTTICASALCTLIISLSSSCHPLAGFRTITASPLTDKVEKYVIPLKKRQVFHPGKPLVVKLGKSPNGNWPSVISPSGDPVVNWQYGSKYTQIADARSMVLKKIKKGYRPIRVAVVDMGYPKNTKLEPILFERGPDFWRMDYDPTSNTGRNHGLSTTNLLAGRKIKIYSKNTGEVIYNDYLGAAPMVEVICVRVAEEVALFGQSPFVEHRLQHVIDWAIKNEVDVISMSMGGAHSFSLAKAVNRARVNGVAMFFAGGNYLTLPFLSVFRTPDTIVFPAAMNGAFGVTGATATDRTYAYPPKYFSFVKNGIGGWKMRGNWKPRWQMKKNIIAAYTPNIAWAKTGEGDNDDSLDMDGAGTSSATPQVAGAAALWLQYHRDAFSKNQWRSKEKVDAVYRALADSARKLPLAPRSEKYTLDHFGFGILQARSALAITPAEAIKKNRVTPINKRPMNYHVGHAILRTLGVFSTERSFYREKHLVPYEQ